MASTKPRSRSLPEKPSEEYLRKEAKRLARHEAIQLAAAQRRLAREYGYRNWTELILHVKALSAGSGGARNPSTAIATEARPALNDMLRRPVEELALSRRALMGLRHENIKHIGELLQRTAEDLLAIRNFGRKSLNEIEGALAQKGLSLGMRLEEERALPFIPLRELIAFPHMVYPVFVGRPLSIRAIKSAHHRKLPILVAAQKDGALENPGDADIYRTGVVASLIKVEELPDGTVKALIEGKRRMRVTRLITDGEFYQAENEALTEPETGSLDELLESVASAYVSSRFKSIAARRLISAATRGNPSMIADRVASRLPIEIARKQELLELLNPAERLKKLLAYLSSESTAPG